MVRPSPASRGYNYKWQKARTQFLVENPLCSFCLKAGRIEPATVVDHIVPHKGDQDLFWDTANWQGLCENDHNSTKQRMEKGSLRTIGLDGFPLDE